MQRYMLKVNGPNPLNNVLCDYIAPRAPINYEVTYSGILQEQTGADPIILDLSIFTNESINALIGILFY